MKSAAGVLFFAPALILAAVLTDPVVPRDIFLGTCQNHGNFVQCQGRLPNSKQFGRACTDGSCKDHRGWGCNLSTNVNPWRVVCPGAE
ncbi:hypothetical protein VHEMI10714 [[Torrubiella] hemipterigena]|uniref:Uncharacterized protein n=1 Tax=[Torrubiella] hemipterigena TaxID=1531966 RepID=A0A0A1TSD6_9HYPO|nr:hypothetical protein VHEMI10714 [[Torrubiella] hemipterigena]